MKQLFAFVGLFLLVLLTVACDRRVEQTLVLRADIDNATQNSVWLTESNNCSASHIAPGWYRNGLWIFRLSSIRGGIGAVTQELTLCANNTSGATNTIWHSIHGGGAPLIVLSCIASEKSSCQMYQDGYTPGAWSGDDE
jgi:hypothetical protein